MLAFETGIYDPFPNITKKVLCVDLFAFYLNSKPNASRGQYFLPKEEKSQKLTINLGMARSSENQPYIGQTQTET